MMECFIYIITTRPLAWDFPIHELNKCFIPCSEFVSLYNYYEIHHIIKPKMINNCNSSQNYLFFYLKVKYSIERIKLSAFRKFLIKLFQEHHLFSLMLRMRSSFTH